MTTPGFNTEHTSKNRKTDPSVLAKQLKGELDWITMKAMAKDRTQRYASASELAADVLRYLKQEPVIAGPPSARYRFRKYVKRHKVGVAAAAVVTLAMIIGITGTSIGLLKAVKAEKKAREDAITAQQVSDFLVALFEVSDPSEARGNTVTAREILDKGAEKIENDLQDQPRIQSSLMETMGKVYRNLGLYDLAASLLEKSLFLKQKVYGDEHIEVANSLHILAVLYDTQGKYQEAESMFRQSLAIKKKTLGQDHPEVASSLNSISIVNWNQGKYEETETLLQRALAIKEKILGPDHLHVEETLEQYARLLHKVDRTGEAEKMEARVKFIREKSNSQE